MKYNTPSTSQTFENFRNNGGKIQYLKRLERSFRGHRQVLRWTCLDCGRKFIDRKELEPHELQYGCQGDYVTGKCLLPLNERIALLKQFQIESGITSTSEIFYCQRATSRVCKRCCIFCFNPCRSLRCWNEGEICARRVTPEEKLAKKLDPTQLSAEEERTWHRGD